MYSVNEIKLFKSLGYDESYYTIEPIVLYRIILEDLFCHGTSGQNVEAFRRGYIACFRKGTVYRNTKEYENLIALEQ